MAGSKKGGAKPSGTYKGMDLSFNFGLNVKTKSKGKTGKGKKPAGGGSA